jgi:hypothetical protein
MDGKNENQEFHFEGQNPGEEIVAVFRHHWIVIVNEIVLFFFVFGFYLFLSLFLFPRAGIGGLAIIILHLLITLSLTFYVHYVFERLIEYFEHIFIITNARLIEIEKKNMDSLDIRTAEDIQKHQAGLFKTFLNFGELHFLNKKFIECVPDPNYFFDIFNKIKFNVIQPPHPFEPRPEPIILIRRFPETIPDVEIKDSSQVQNKKEQVQLAPPLHVSTLELEPPKENNEVNRSDVPVKYKEEKPGIEDEK